MDYIHQENDWPNFTWDQTALADALADVRNRQGRLVGRMEALGFQNQREAVLKTLTQDVIKTSEIEGERLADDQVRSSIARRLGMDIAGLVASDRNVDGIVEMMLDATQNYSAPLTEERLFSWHSSLFPTARSGMNKIVTGAWRTAATGPMQVVSGPIGRERVHFEAPHADMLPKEMRRFFGWFENPALKLDPVMKAAVAHFWFVTVHPFEDGNGRIARAVADLALARSDQTKQRFYSMSSQIRIERKAYYDTLEACQKGSLNITEWLDWFLACLGRSIEGSALMLETVLRKARFWEMHAQANFNERQTMMLNRLFDGFEGKLTSSKWAMLAKCSQDTALRDIDDLLRRRILERGEAGGRSASYDIGKTDTSILNYEFAKARFAVDDELKAARSVREARLCLGEMNEKVTAHMRGFVRARGFWRAGGSGGGHDEGAGRGRRRGRYCRLAGLY
jgi:Fic family protein